MMSQTALGTPQPSLRARTPRHLRCERPLTGTQPHRPTQDQPGPEGLLRQDWPEQTGGPEALNQSGYRDCLTLEARKTSSHRLTSGITRHTPKAFRETPGPALPADCHHKPHPLLTKAVHRPAPSGYLAPSGRPRFIATWGRAAGGQAVFRALGTEKREDKTPSLRGLLFDLG